MALDTQLVEYRFSGGPSEKDEQRLAPEGAAQRVLNGTYAKRNRIDKRLGYDNFGKTVYASPKGSSSLGTASGLFAHRDEIVIGDQTEMWSWSPSLTKWVYAGKEVSADVRSDSAGVYPGASTLTVDEAITLDGIRVLVWTESGSGILYASVDDLTTGASIATRARISTTGKTASSPRCVAIGSKVAILFRYPAATELIMVIADPSLASFFTAETVLHTDSSGLFDLCFSEGVSVTNWVYVYTKNSGDIGVSRRLVSTYAQTHATTITTVTPTAVGICSRSGQETYVLLNDFGNGGKAIVYNEADLTLVTGAVTFETADCAIVGGVCISDGSIQVAYSVSATQRTGHRTVASNGTLGTKHLTYFVSLYSKPFYDADQDETFAWVHANSTYVLCRLDTAVDAGNAAPLWPVSALLFERALSISTSPRNVTENPTTGAWHVVTNPDTYPEDSQVLFGPGDRSYGSIGGATYASGPTVTQYGDGVLCENGWFQRPVITSAAVNGAGTIDAGTYNYRVVFEYTDVSGRIHRSAPSDSETVVVAGSEQVELFIQPPTLVRRHGVEQSHYPNIRVVVYRNAAGTGGPADVFYRIWPEHSTPTALVVDALPTALVSVFDNNPDANIVANEGLYTNSGELPNSMIPGGAPHLAVHKNRVWAVSGEDRYRVFFSKEHIEGEPLAFNIGLSMRFDGDGGEVKAVASLDDTLLVFKETKIYAIAGDGPNNTGDVTVADFSRPHLVSPDIGCAYPASVARIPAGILFASAKGFYLLDRGRNLTYVGADIEDTFGFLSVTSAVVDADNHRVIFHMDGDGQYKFLVYNYYFKKWSEWVMADDTTPNRYGALFDGRHIHTGGDASTNLFQVGSQYQDALADFEYYVTTPWLTFDVVEAFKRLRRVLVNTEYHGAHGMKVTLETDFGDGTTQSYTFTESEVGSAVKAGQFRISPADAKAQGWRIKVEEVPAAAGATQAFSLISLGLQVGMKQGARLGSGSTR